MKLIISTILLLIFQTLTIFGDDIFIRISNKTWFEDNGFAGTSLVFYKTDNGLIKSIRQINGSGVPVVSSGIYDVEIRQDTIYLFNGLNLKTSEKLIDLSYTFDKNLGLLLIKEKSLRIIHDEPILYAWTNKRKNVKTRVDVKLLSEILIEKKEIYREEDLIKTLTE